MAAEDARSRPGRPPPPYCTVPAQQEESTGTRHIKRLHDEGYLYIQQGLSCDEHGQGEQALTLYTKGLRCIDYALEINCDFPQSLQQMREKMVATKAQIQLRVEALLSSDANAARSVVDPPPTYEQSMTPTQSDFDLMLSETLSSDNLTEAQAATDASARELFQIRDGVQIFFITPEGYVSAPSYPSSLGIYQFTEALSRQISKTSDGEQAPPAFLKVGDWSYPLLAGRSPVLHASWGAYIFPDVNSQQEGASVGVIIPDCISADERSKFENLLNSFTVMKTEDANAELVAETKASVAPVRPPLPSIEGNRTSTKIAKGLETASDWLSWGLQKGAEKTGVLLQRGSERLRESLQPEAQASKIDPRAQKGLYYTRKATEGVVQVSGYLVNKLGEGTMYLGRKVAPIIREEGEKYLPKSLTKKDSSDGQSKIGDVVEVAAGGLRGWATVYVGLESAAKVLAKSMASETVNVVQHKYGTEAGELTGNALYSATNVAVAGFTINNLGAKAIAKRMAKDTGSAYVADYDETLHSKSEAEASAMSHSTSNSSNNSDSSESKKSKCALEDNVCSKK